MNSKAALLKYGPIVDSSKYWMDFVNKHSAKLTTGEQQILKSLPNNISGVAILNYDNDFVLTVECYDNGKYLKHFVLHFDESCTQFDAAIMGKLNGVAQNLIAREDEKRMNIRKKNKIKLLLKGLE